MKKVIVRRHIQIYSLNKTNNKNIRIYVSFDLEKYYRKDKGVATVREFCLSGEEKFLRIVIMNYGKVIVLN